MHANVRKLTHLKGDFAPFWTFFDKFVPNIASKKVWSNKVKISARITDSKCEMITDKAFIVVALENNWDHCYAITKKLPSGLVPGMKTSSSWADVMKPTPTMMKSASISKSSRAHRPLRASRRNSRCVRAHDAHANGRVMSCTDTSKERQ
jgi:hypothetical protein